MKRILIITALSLCTASIASALQRSDYEVLVIVDSPSAQAEICPLIVPIQYIDTYIAEPTGEVIPEFVPGDTEKTRSAHKADVFHPPKLR